MPRLSEAELEAMGVPIGGLSYGQLSDIPNFYIPSKSNWDGGLPPMSQSDMDAQVSISNALLQTASMQATMGAVVSRVGIPVDAEFNALLQSFLDDIKKKLKELLANFTAYVMAALEDALKAAMAGLGIAMDMIGAIPVYGWIIKAVLGLVKAIVGLVQMFRAEDAANKAALMGPQSTFPYFDPFADESVFNNHVLAPLKGSLDWTGLWTPPYTGNADPVTERRFGTVDYEGGHLFGVSGVFSEKTGKPGCTPGIGWVHQGILISDVTDKYNPSTQAVEAGNVRYPSTRQQNGPLWKSLMRNNMQPGIFCVDAEFLYTRWAHYIEQWWHFLYSSDFPARWVNAIQNTWGGTPQQPGPFFGIDLTVAPTDLAVEQVLVVKESKALRDRQTALLNTTLIAYLDSGMVVFKKNNQLKIKWEGRKMDLLQHGARCSVNVNDVEYSDPVYMQALIESGVGSIQCGPTQLAASVQNFNEPVPPSGTTEMGGVLGAPPPPSATPSDPGFWEQYGLWLAGIGVVSAAGYALYRRNRR